MIEFFSPRLLLTAIVLYTSFTLYPIIQDNSIRICRQDPLGKMDLRRKGISSAELQLFFQPIFSEATGSFSRRFRYKYNEKFYECPSNIMSDFLFAEYQVRVAAQLKASSKVTPLYAIVKYSMREMNLFLKELALPPRALPLAFAERDPRWYFSDQLVTYCKRSGGCCGRSCGCCIKRLPEDRPSMTGISGHCSWGCPCCMKWKDPGDPYWASEGSLLKQQYKDVLESDNPTVLLRLADAYFSAEPMPQPASNQASGKSYTGKAKSNYLEPGPSSNSNATSKEIIQNGVMDEVSYSSPPPYEHDVDGDRDMRGDQGTRIEAEEVSSTTTICASPNGGATSTLPWLKRSLKSRK